MGFTTNPWRSTPSKYTATVTDQQTIQHVIDKVPVMTGDLVSGITNPYVVKVPPGHETEFYSLVRNASDVASDKRNVTVVFEDNPDGKFIIDSMNTCDSLTGWTASDGAVSLSSEHVTQGEYSIKGYNSGSTGNLSLYLTFSPEQDWKKYNGIIFDLYGATEEFSPLGVTYYSDGHTKYTDLSDYGVDSCYGDNLKVTIYEPFVTASPSNPANFENVSRVRIRLYRPGGYTGTQTVYIDNIRLVRTDKCASICFRFDDAMDEHKTIAAKLLEAKGWLGNFAINNPHMSGSTRMTLANMEDLSVMGHDLINHMANDVSPQDDERFESYDAWNNCQQWLISNGFTQAINLFVNPNHATNEWMPDILRKGNVISTIPFLGGFPLFMRSVESAGYSETVWDDYFTAGFGGVCLSLTHTISGDDETNFSAYLDWVETHFSKVYVLSQVAGKLPSGFVPVRNTGQKRTGWAETLTDNYYCYPGRGYGHLLLDPGGSNRNIYLIGSFTQRDEIKVINTADAAETLTFDPLFTSSGAHAGANGANTLTVGAETWVINQLVSRTVNNTSDGSSGVITANTGTTVTAVLSGGTDNGWDTGDNYTITPVGSAQDIAQGNMQTFVYDGEGWY